MIKQLSIDIECFLKSTHQELTDDLRRMATEYARVAKMFNEDLNQAEKLLAQGELKPLLSFLYDCNPSFKERAQALLLKEIQVWYEICEDYKLDLGEKINAKRVDYLLKNSFFEEQIPFLMEQWRTLNRTGPHEEKLNLLREISYCSLNAFHPLHQAHEEEAKKESLLLIQEAKNAIDQGEFEHLNQIEKQMQKQDIIHLIHPKILSKIQCELYKHKKSIHRIMFDHLLSTLSDAYALCDYEHIETLLIQIEDKKKTPLYEPKENDELQISSTRSWYENMKETKANEQRYGYLLRLLTQHLDERQFDEAERVRYEILQLRNESLPQILESRYHQLVEIGKLRISAKKRLYFAGVFIFLFALILGIGFSLVQWRTAYQQKQVLAVIKTQIDAKKYELAYESVQINKVNLPELGNNETFQKYLELIEQALKNKEEKQKQCKDALNEIQVLVATLPQKPPSIEKTKPLIELLEQCHSKVEQTRTVIQQNLTDSVLFNQQLTEIEITLENRSAHYQELIHKAYGAQIQLLRDSTRTMSLIAINDSAIFEKLQTELQQTTVLFEKLKRDSKSNLPIYVGPLKTIEQLQKMVVFNMNKYSAFQDLLTAYKEIESFIGYKNFFKAIQKTDIENIKNNYPISDEKLNHYEEVKKLGLIATNVNELKKLDLSNWTNDKGFNATWGKSFERIQSFFESTEVIHETIFQSFNLFYDAIAEYPIELILKTKTGQEDFLYMKKEPLSQRNSKDDIVLSWVITPNDKNKLEKITFRYESSTRDWSVINGVNGLEKKYSFINLKSLENKNYKPAHRLFLEEFTYEYTQKKQKEQVGYLLLSLEKLSNIKSINPYWQAHIANKILQLLASSSAISKMCYSPFATDYAKEISIFSKTWYLPTQKSTIPPHWLKQVFNTNYKEIYRKNMDFVTQTIQAEIPVISPAGMIKKNGEHYDIQMFNEIKYPCELWTIERDENQLFIFNRIGRAKQEKEFDSLDFSSVHENQLLWTPLNYSCESILASPIKIQKPACWPANIPWSPK